MACISLDPKSGLWRIFFRFAGKGYHRSLKTDDQQAANAWKARIEETLHDLERGRLTLPAGADFWEFVKTDGKRSDKLRVEEGKNLDELFAWYFASLPDESKGTKTIKVQNIHAGHFKRHLGAKRKLREITGRVLQEEYVNQRARADYYGKPICSQTIKKEIDTLRMMWNRALRQQVEGVMSECPCRGLDYPAKKDAPPFQTWKQIETAIARGTDKALWNSLFLDVDQVSEALEHVRTKETGRQYFYPLMVFVAHTGARLSECMRSRVEDFDFQARQVRIREKKKKRGTETYRWVYLTPTLAETMRSWFAEHPGGQLTICRLPDKKFHEQTLHDDFEWFMKDSKWDVLKGFHVFRHSFASNLARKGTDQRIIDELMGHQTEEMRKRYRHLFPQDTRNAVAALFAR